MKTKQTAREPEMAANIEFLENCVSKGEEQVPFYRFPFPAKARSRHMGRFTNNIVGYSQYAVLLPTK